MLVSLARQSYISPLSSVGFRAISSSLIIHNSAKFSTHTRPPTSTASTAQDDATLLAVKTGTRPKLDLRPAPLKPGSKISPTAHVGAPLNPPDRAAAPTASDASQATAPKGLKETIQSDIQQAEELGILKPTPADASGVQRIFHKTWEMTKFYFRGAKAIYTRRETIAGIKSRVAAGSAVQRWENRLLLTQRQDVNKVIPFIILAVFLEELVPVLALYAPFMLPSTCLLPAQRQRIESAKTAKAVSAAALNRSILTQLKGHVTSEGILPLAALHEGEATTVLCSLLRLPTFGFDHLRILRIKRHLSFISTDDQLLQRDGLQHVSEVELDEALRERGFIINGLGLKEKTSKLAWWLDSVQTTASEHAVVRRLALIVQRK